MARSCTTLDLSAFTAWEDGARAHTVARSFAIETDEPTPLVGTDRRPTRWSCYWPRSAPAWTIGWVTQATPI